MINRAIGIAFVAAAVVQVLDAREAWSIWSRFGLDGFQRQAGLALALAILYVTSGVLFWSKGGGDKK